MGRSLHKRNSFRFPLKLFFLISFALIGCSNELKDDSLSASNEINADMIRPVESVAALGQLSPVGHVRRLAAPLSGFGGTPRISKLLVKEGDFVNKGQILAIFDNRPKVSADLLVLKAKIDSLNLKVSVKKKEVSRYYQASLNGASPLVILDQKKEQLYILKGELNQALAEKNVLETDLDDTQLRSPINGVILRIYSRAGERPDSKGVLEVGANNSMEALIEVYESDVSRVKIGQKVTLISENGGFEGHLMSKVVSISPQVRQRRVLSTDPTGDADARVVEVKVLLNQESAAAVNNFSGMKVIAKFQPL